MCLVLCLSGLGRRKGSGVVVGVTASGFVERKMPESSEQMPDPALGNSGRPSSKRSEVSFWNR